MLVAAEASGDVLGAGLARALKARLGEVRFVGVGGEKMAAEGVESPFDIRDLSILGLLEGLLAYPRVVKRADETCALAMRDKPDIAVLIDSWGFTLRVAQRLKKAMPGLPVVKYVGPQVWASRPGRARTLAATVDHLMSIHAFDAPYFEAEGLKTSFVGNPTLARDFAGADGERLRRNLGMAPDAQVLLMLPGSRPSEIKRVMPPFEEAARLLKAQRPGLEVVIPAATTVAEAVRARAAALPFPVHVLEGDEARYDAMKAATVALACSGTVTTELALAGCPMVVGYRLGHITYAIALRLIRTPYITLLNIAAGEPVAPEFIQGRCNGPELAKALALRLDDPTFRAGQIAAQNAALARMGRGGPDPSERAAEVVAGLLPHRA
ncbi:lipid-A-disaccharide synthase [Phenylobacterium montanum]|uniref:Lipid-A-disaccharide synthase n=1 Tax=Phenylobacterium montanum TaxID=2823693 RepID=A0A975IXG8_9CAUL|nr:lipid-A-disaccharide synthase [Caulobacter sp. S6]QUD90629.1 lipid-A-disaccharide synthase [Caulobacter sp. S6]